MQNAGLREDQRAPAPPLAPPLSLPLDPPLPGAAPSVRSSKATIGRRPEGQSASIAPRLCPSTRDWWDVRLPFVTSSTTRAAGETFLTRGGVEAFAVGPERRERMAPQGGRGMCAGPEATSAAVVPSSACSGLPWKKQHPHPVEFPGVFSKSLQMPFPLSSAFSAPKWNATEGFT